MFDRILRLQRSLPTPPPMLAPFKVDPNDVLNLQAAAGRLARHVGLGELTFIVAVTTQPPDVAGHVEIKYAQKEVFIEISDRILPFPRAVLATLAHEVTHKYLHTHGIWLADLLENERLTDTAAVFNGLGVLMLNGCQDEMRRREGDVEYVHQFRGGYLGRTDLAKVYVATLLSRGASVSMTGLTPDAQRAVQSVQRPMLKQLSPKKSADALADQLEDRVRDEQQLLAAAERDLRRLTEKTLPELKARIAARHKALRLNQDELHHLRTDGTDLQKARAQAMIAALTERCEGPTRQLRKTLGQARQTVEALVDLPVEASRICICGACGGKLRLPADKSVIVARCPHCDYRFTADTTTDGPADPKRRGWRGWLGS
jgi:hypothetical protein